MALSKKKRFFIFARDGFTCRYCGRNSKSTTLEVDHIHPRSKGGTDDPSNLVTACFDCNRGKSDALIRPAGIDGKEKQFLECSPERFKRFHQSLMDWEWYSCWKTTRVFVHLLTQASSKARQVCGEKIPIGSVVTSPSALANATALTRQKVRTAFRRLKETGYIETSQSSRGTIVTILNFDHYAQD